MVPYVVTVLAMRTKNAPGTRRPLSPRGAAARAEREAFNAERGRADRADMIRMSWEFSGMFQRLTFAEKAARLRAELGRCAYEVEHGRESMRDCYERRGLLVDETLSYAYDKHAQLEQECRAEIMADGLPRGEDQPAICYMPEGYQAALFP